MAENRAVKRLSKNYEEIRVQVSTISEMTTIEEIGMYQDMLASQWKEFQTLEKTLKGKFDDTNLDTVDKIESVHFELEKTLFKWGRKQQANQHDQGDRTFEELVLNQSNFLHEFSTMNRRESEVRLPRVNIPSFSGTYSEFPSFRDLFDTSIHQKNNISKVHKLQYLKGVLQGEAYSLIKHLSVTEANYDEAWDKINKRYNKPKHIIHALVKQFMDQANMQLSCSKSLRQLADVSDEVIRGLKVLGDKAEQRDPWLIYILAHKLDNESKEAWAHETTDNDYPSLAQFMEFIHKRSDALESLSSMSKGKATSAKRVISMTTQVPSSCPLCSGDHYLGKCEQYLSFPV